MDWLEAIIIAVVEGITEFLPVSSTGHMIITEKLLGMESTDFTKAFVINIQFGAILSVIVLYWKRFFKTINFYYKLFIAFIPAAVIGLLAGDYIDSMLENVVVVAVSLVLGGIILVFVDNWFKKPDENQEVNYPKAFKIGLFQVIAMIPGVSRSAATIIGGMTQKLNRKTAAEFSFFLAVPTMFAASAYKLTKNYEAITSENLTVLIIGNIVAFFVALIAIKSFIHFLTKYGFKIFGYYRIILGLTILVLVALGIDLQVV
ncbi:MAG: undecaprenyl-diphosphate phosphatase [Bacteroidales bacterium]|nr:undecaprenyl-diphosphate phosphatase [Bacteroidales bacterium]